MSVLFSSCLGCCNLKKIKTERRINGKTEAFCNAFPEGIPLGFLSVDERKSGEICNNGIGYEEDPQKAAIFK